MQKVNNHEKGRMLFEKLKSLSDSGELSLAKNRRDLASLVGYSPEEVETKGLSWVSRLIQRGIIEERLLRFNENNKAENAYYLTGKELSYVWGNNNATVTAAIRKAKLAKQDKPAIKPVEVVAPKVAKIIPKLSIFKGDMVITFEDIDVAIAKELLDSIL